jgi:hypothetical protein
MTTQTQTPSALEQALLSFEESIEGRKAVLETFLASRVWILLDSPWDGRSLPSTETHLLFVSDGENQDQAMLAVFTDRARAEATAPAMGDFRHAVEVDSQWALLGVIPNSGVRINPNSEPSFRILPELVVELRKIAESGLLRRQRAAASSPTGSVR